MMLRSHYLFNYALYDIKIHFLIKKRNIELTCIQFFSKDIINQHKYIYNILYKILL